MNVMYKSQRMRMYVCLILHQVHVSTSSDLQAAREALRERRVLQNEAETLRVALSELRETHSELQACDSSSSFFY